MSNKIVISLNSAWNLVNFRSGLIRALVAAGYDVVAVAPNDAYAQNLPALGCRFVPLAMDNQGTHPLRDFMLLCRYMKVLRAERPNVYLGYTVKPNVYGSMAARALRIPIINNVAGLGAVFIKGGWLNTLVKFLYKIALMPSQKVFFQNKDDQKLFIDHRLVTPLVTDLLPGSGIDLEKFSVAPLPNKANIRFLLVGRMLWDKGIGEFVEAARLLKQRGIEAECCLLGFLDVKNPAAISRSQMDAWVAEGVVSYLGVSDNVSDEITQADCIVLPSYREGTPRSLLEAAAMARPIITTDAVGCREVVDDGVNGYLCQTRDANDLAEQMARIASMAPGERTAMGQRGRAKVEREFDERIVISKYLTAIESVLGNKPPVPVKSKRAESSYI